MKASHCKCDEFWIYSVLRLLPERPGFAQLPILTHLSRFEIFPDFPICGKLPMLPITEKLPASRFVKISRLSRLSSSPGFPISMGLPIVIKPPDYATLPDFPINQNLPASRLYCAPDCPDYVHPPDNYENKRGRPRRASTLSDSLIKKFLPIWYISRQRCLTNWVARWRFSRLCWTPDYANLPTFPATPNSEGPDYKSAPDYMDFSR